MSGPVDLVLGGGGVRGVAHVGALAVLVDEGYEVQRVAGASSGALAGAMIAAGATPDEMRQALIDLDWRAITAADLVGRLTGAPLIGNLVDRLATGRTIDPLRWITDHLEERGVRTWADLRVEDPPEWMPEAQRYRLVVRALDIVNHRIVRLPWDYRDYGIDPDEASVAEAVRASMAVPVVFDPVVLGDPEDGGGLLIDGGLGTGFPVSALDRTDGQLPRHPTFGLRLVERRAEQEWPTSELDTIRAVFRTMIETGNQMRPTNPCDADRTVTLSTAHIRTLDVGITPEQEDDLFEIGADAMRTFLTTWDFDAHRHRCR